MHVFPWSKIHNHSFKYSLIKRNSTSKKLGLDDAQIPVLKVLQAVRSKSRVNARLLEPKGESKGSHTPIGYNT
jgi:hypothetical protein